MWLASVLCRLRGASKSPPGLCLQFRPRVEYLEDRSLPSATATTLTVSPNPATVGQSVTLTATITGGDFPAGGGSDIFFSLTFKDGASTLSTVHPISTGGPNHESRAQFTTSSLAVGNHSFVAGYKGEFDYSDLPGGFPNPF